MANIRTIALNGAETKVEIAGQNCAVRNDGTGTVYASRRTGIIAGADGVLAVPAGQSAVLRDTCGTLYLLGTGSVQLVGADYDSIPFKTVSASGGSGADEVARAAISAHAGNAEVHVTTDEKSAWNAKAELSDIPTSLPADGGNAATVNGHTVNSDVPANAKYTDTVYTHPAYTARTGVPTANQTPAFGGSFAVTQPVSDSTGHITAMTSRTITIPSTAASASAAGLVTTGAQTLAGNKTFNGQILPNGASAYATPQARKLSSGTAAATAANCPVGAWYGQHS